MDFGQADSRPRRTVLGLGRPAAESTAQLGDGLSHIPIHYVDKAQDGAHSAIGTRHSSQKMMSSKLAVTIYCIVIIIIIIIISLIND